MLCGAILWRYLLLVVGRKKRPDLILRVASLVEALGGVGRGRTSSKQFAGG